VNAGIQHLTHSYDGHVVSFISGCRADLPSRASHTRA